MVSAVVTSLPFSIGKRAENQFGRAALPSSRNMDESCHEPVEFLFPINTLKWEAPALCMKGRAFYNEWTEAGVRKASSITTFNDEALLHHLLSIGTNWFSIGTGTQISMERQI